MLAIAFKLFPRNTDLRKPYGGNEKQVFVVENSVLETLVGKIEGDIGRINREMRAFDEGFESIFEAARLIRTKVM